MQAMKLQSVLYLNIIPVHHSEVSQAILFKAVNGTFSLVGPLSISLNSEFLMCLSLPIRKC